MIVDLTPLPNSWSIEKIEDKRSPHHGEIGPTLMVCIILSYDPYGLSVRTKDGYWQTWKRMSAYRFKELCALWKPQRAFAG